jgi:hypothetical protein
MDKKAVVLDKDIYEKAKTIVYAQYRKASAYRSGALVRKYKDLGGRYSNEINKKKASLTRWFKEKWTDVNPMKNKTSYPVYRPTVRITRKMPLTVEEIDKKDLIIKSKQKQKIKGNKNLKAFKGKK